MESVILKFIPAIILSVWTGFSSTIITLPNVANYGIVTDIQNIDLNNDGLQDLVLFRTREDPFYRGLYVQALVNTGNKTFADQTTAYFGSVGNEWDWIEKAYLADLNGDGRKDIVGHCAYEQLPGYGFDILPPLIRQPDNSFRSTNNPLVFSLRGCMIPIDANNDGRMDLLFRDVINFGEATLQYHAWTLLQNNTTNVNNLSFISRGVVSQGAKMGWDYSTFVNAPAVIDINGDGYDDIVYGGPKWKYNDWINEVTPLHVYLNNRNNIFTESSSSVFSGAIPQFAHTREMVQGDFYNNGRDSIVIANTGYDKYPFPGEGNAILRNNGNGFLTVDYGDGSTHNYAGFTHSVDAGDIDADGDLDVIYTDVTGDDSLPSEEVRILINDGEGNFNRKTFSINGSINGFINGWTATKLVDLDNNGYP